MSVLPIGLSGPISRKMFPQAAPPPNTNYADLALGSEYVRQNDRVGYYEKKGIGKRVPIPGAAGLGSGISHYVYRVPKSELLTREQVRNLEKNEYNAMMAVQAAEKAAADVVRKGEMNANVAGIIYTNDPMTAVDIDKPIHLESLEKIGKNLVKKNAGISQRKRNAALAKADPENIKWARSKGNPYLALGEMKMNDYTIDEIIEVLREKFIENEKDKMRSRILAEVKKTLPNWPVAHNSAGVMMRQSEQRYKQNQLIQDHIDRKLPKIEAVLAKLREGMILGFAPSAPKVVPKEENLLRFENLSSINFSAPPGSGPAGSGAPVQVDPFEGLGGKRKTRRRRSSKKTRKGGRK